MASSTAPCPSNAAPRSVARVVDQREPLLGSQHLKRVDLEQGALGLAAIEVNHRGHEERDALRERVGDLLGQHQGVGHAGERPLGISEHPFGLCAIGSGANAGIMSAIDETMGRMSCRIVEPAPGIGMLTGVCPVPGSPHRPPGMMRLEAQAIVFLAFGHLEQSIRDAGGLQICRRPRQLSATLHRVPRTVGARRRGSPPTHARARKAASLRHRPWWQTDTGPMPVAARSRFCPGSDSPVTNAASQDPAPNGQSLPDR